MTTIRPSQQNPHFGTTAQNLQNRAKVTQELANSSYQIADAHAPVVLGGGLAGGAAQLLPHEGDNRFDFMNVADWLQKTFVKEGAKAPSKVDDVQPPKVEETKAGDAQQSKVDTPKTVIQHNGDKIQGTIEYSDKHNHLDYKTYDGKAFFVKGEHETEWKKLDTPPENLESMTREVKPAAPEATPAPEATNAETKPAATQAKEAPTSSNTESKTDTPEAKADTPEVTTEAPAEQVTKTINPQGQTVIQANPDAKPDFDVDKVVEMGKTPHSVKDLAQEHAETFKTQSQGMLDDTLKPYAEKANDVWHNLKAQFDASNAAQKSVPSVTQQNNEALKAFKNIESHDVNQEAPLGSISQMDRNLDGEGPIATLLRNNISDHASPDAHTQLAANTQTYQIPDNTPGNFTLTVEKRGWFGSPKVKLGDAELTPESTVNTNLPNETTPDTDEHNWHDTLGHFAHDASDVIHDASPFVLIPSAMAGLFGLFAKAVGIGAQQISNNAKAELMRLDAAA
ncbi:MAG: hypothetical protein VKJ06_04465 [Vampirovibrionales bacterium]|nr:hypothetical protein [Vampirovibrionales bacterium]